MHCRACAPEAGRPPAPRGQALRKGCSNYARCAGISVPLDYIIPKIEKLHSEVSTRGDFVIEITRILIKASECVRSPTPYQKIRTNSPDKNQRCPVPGILLPRRGRQKLCAVGSFCWAELTAPSESSHPRIQTVKIRPGGVWTKNYQEFAGARLTWITRS